MILTPRFLINRPSSEWRLPIASRTGSPLRELMVTLDPVAQAIGAASLEATILQALRHIHSRLVRAVS